MKRTILIVIIPITCFVLYYVSSNWYYKAEEQRLLSLKSIHDIEAALGGPVEVIDSYPPKFGSKMVKPEEFSKGILIKVYLFRKSPPRLLVVKVEEDSSEVLNSVMEDT